MRSSKPSNHAQHPSFNSVEELIEYVERKARERVERIRSKYGALAEDEAYDRVVLKLMREFEEPMSIDLISFISGIDKPRCCKVLKRLEEKWKLVRRVTVAKVSYYRATSADDGGPSSL